jgi:hypothetical protein
MSAESLTTEINNFKFVFPQVRWLDLGGGGDPGNLGLAFGCPEYKIRDLSAQRAWERSKWGPQEEMGPAGISLGTAS